MESTGTKESNITHRRWISGKSSNQSILDPELNFFGLITPVRAPYVRLFKVRLD